MKDYLVQTLVIEEVKDPDTSKPGTPSAGKAGISVDKTTGIVTVSLGYEAPANTYADVTLTQLDNASVTVSQRIDFKVGTTSGTTDFSAVMSVGKTYKAEVSVGGTTYTTTWAYNG